MALTPDESPLGEGVFVASKGKVSLIVDADRDGKADKEIIVAQGWKELPHGVDALGVALDGAGNVYFGLGTTDFTNAYQVDAHGQAALRPQGRARHDPASLARLPQARDHRHGHSLPGRAGVQSPAATCSRPTRKARPGSPTATRSTSCCTSSQAGITAFRPGTRGTFPR